MDYTHEVSQHNIRLLNDPQFRMLEMLEDLRVDMIPGRGGDLITEEPEPIVKSKSIYFKMDRGAFDLNHRVNELENTNQYLIRKQEYTSKRKSNYKYNK